MTEFIPQSHHGLQDASAMSIGDWLIQVLNVKKSNKESKNYYDKLYPHFRAGTGSDDSPNYTDIFELFISEAETVFSFLDDAYTQKGVIVYVLDSEGQKRKQVHKSYTEVLKEVEQFFIVLMYIVSSKLPQNTAIIISNYVEKICKELANSSNHSELRLKLLKNLYNVFPVDSQCRFLIFNFALNYSIKTNQFSSMFPYIRYLNEWMKDWGLPLTQKRHIYLVLADQLKKLDRHDEAYPLLKKHIQLYQGEKSQTLSSDETVSAAVALAHDSIMLPDIVYFDSILELDAIKNLRNTQHRNLVDLLEIFLRGGPHDLENFCSTYPDFFQNNDLDYNLCLRKIRLLAITSLAADHNELDLANISNALSLSEDDTQEVVVQSIGQGLIDAKIDQINKVINVRSAMQREFSQAQWEALAKKLKGWSENVSMLLSNVSSD